jgi:rhomboid protease GluP
MSDEAGKELSSSIIPAPSRPKAMDWSLVLASQDIPHFIASPDASGAWALRVATADFPSATASIEQFERENQTRAWQQHYLEGRIVFDWLALLWVVTLVAIHLLAGSGSFVEKSGVMHGVQVSHGEWWRLVTATQLHADWSHIASNMVLGFVLLGLVMGRWGTATGMFAALLAGVGGNFADWLVMPERHSLGASTVVMGCIGLLATMPRSRHPDHAVWRGVFGSISGALLLFILLGLDPRSDVLAHAGGFATGIALAMLLRWQPLLTRGRHMNWISAIALAGLVIAAWWCALSPAASAPHS